MTSTIKRTSPSDVLGALPNGVPVCHFYHSPEEYLDAAIALIRCRNSSEHRFIWIHPDALARDMILDRLLEIGINDASEREGDRFLLMSFSAWIHLHRDMDYTTRESVWRGMVDENLSIGYKKITALFSQPENGELLPVNVPLLTDSVRGYVHESPVTLFFQYDANRLSTQDLINLTAQHEYILSKEQSFWTICHNTIHRQAREDLERSKNYYLTIFEEFPSMIWRAGLDSLCNYFNKNWLSFTGQPLEHEVGNGWAEGVHPDDRERCVKHYSRHFEARKPFVMEYRLKRHDGEYRWIQDMGMPFYDLEKNFAGYIGTCYDITIHRSMEDNLRALTKEAQEASHAKSAFLSNMSHEIRTPMNGVIGMLELLSMTELEDHQQDYVEKARTSAQLLLRIINDILDLSKIEAGKLELESKAFSLQSIAETAIETVLPGAKKKGLALSLQMDNALRSELVGDPVRMTQILINLLNNGVKFTDTGKVELVIELIAETDREVRLLFSVNDTGIGIPPAQQDKLFQSFSQLSNAGNRKFGGTGLGLAICHQLVSQMGGEIQVSSVEDLGSSFSFQLGFQKSTDTGEGTSPSHSHVQLERKVPIPLRRSGEKLHVLAAEDDAINQQILREMLSDLFHLDIVSNGMEAVNMYRNNRYDIVLMDVQMPVMDGLEATEAIRLIETDTKSHVPIIGFTAYAMVSDGERCLASGMDSFLAKPVDRSTLLKSLYISDWRD